jgi:hypothetical protein
MLGVYYEDDEGFEDDDNHKDNEMAIPSKSIKQGFQFRRKYMDVGVGQVKKSSTTKKKSQSQKSRYPNTMKSCTGLRITLKKLFISPLHSITISHQNPKVALNKHLASFRT